MRENQSNDVQKNGARNCEIGGLRSARSGSNQSTAAHTTIIIVHPTRLFRSCLRQALEMDTSYRVHDFDHFVDANEIVSDVEGESLLLTAVEGDGSEQRETFLSEVVALCGDRVPVVVTGDSARPEVIAGLLRQGVRGYIPTDFDLPVAIQAMRLILAGGHFAPASCLLDLKAPSKAAEQHNATLENLTAKQRAVMDAIRRGKANKTIAYELNMCESTVKVHVRNIMKKLQATNRTQVAYIANQMS